jgi:hypothetical protein
MEMNMENVELPKAMLTEMKEEMLCKKWTPITRR